MCMLPEIKYLNININKLILFFIIQKLKKNKNAIHSVSYEFTNIHTRENMSY